MFLELDRYRQIFCNKFSLHSQLTDFFNVNDLSCFKLIHLNIRSLFRNWDYLLLLLESVKVNFNCLVFKEAWLNEHKPIPNLDGYDVFYTTDNWNRSDSVIVYLRSDLGGVCRRVRLGEATALALDFTVDKQRYQLLALYRSPAMDCDYFLTALNIYFTNLDFHNSCSHVFVFHPPPPNTVAMGPGNRVCPGPSKADYKAECVLICMHLLMLLEMS